MRYTTSALKATALALPLGFVGLTSAEAAGVVETIQQSPRLGTFYQALQQAGLVEQISGAEAVTVFAPTDEAFEALPDQTVQALLAPENQDALRTLLNYHLVEGRRIASTELPEQVETESGTLYVGLLEGRPVLSRSEARGDQQAAAVTGVGPAAGAQETDPTGGAGVGRLAQPGPEGEEVEADLVQDLEATSPDELQDEAPLAQEEAADETVATGTMGQDDTAGILGGDEDEGGPETLTEMVAGDEGQAAREETTAPGELVQAPEATSPSELQDEAPLAQADVAEERTATGLVGQEPLGDEQTVTEMATGQEREPMQQPTAAGGAAYTYDEAAFAERFGEEPSEGAQIVEADVEADNGVIHVIDYVLVPNAVIEAMLQ